MTPEQWVEQLMRDDYLCYEGAFSSRIVGEILLVVYQKRLPC